MLKERRQSWGKLKHDPWNHKRGLRCQNWRGKSCAYVERGSRDFYRIPKEALIGKPGASRLVHVSKNPFVTSLEARLRYAQHNIEPNF
jgi:hypothetical protein